MKPVESSQLPVLVESGPHIGSIQALIQAMTRFIAQAASRMNGTYPKDGSEGLTPYTVATRPAAADCEGAIIYVSDAGAGAKYQGSDGTNWVNLG